MAGLRAGEDNVHRLGSALSAGQIEERGFLGNNFSHISDELSRNWQSATAQSAKTDYLIAEKAGHLNNHLSEVKHHVAKDVWKSSSILGREFDRRHEWQMRELYHLDKHQDKNTEKIRRAGSEHFAATNLQIAKSEALLAQQAASNFGKAQLDLCKTENAIQLQAANNYANIQLEALKNKEQLAKQMAECCCEIKELVITTSGTTQDVVKNAETERLRDSLRSLETQNMILSVHNGGPGRRQECADCADKICKCKPYDPCNRSTHNSSNSHYTEDPCSKPCVPCVKFTSCINLQPDIILNIDPPCVTTVGSLCITQGSSCITQGNMTQGNMTLGNISFSQGNINFSQGSISFEQGNLEYSGGNLEISQGNISLSQGNISLSQGNLSFSQGNFGAQGNISLGNTILHQYVIPPTTTIPSSVNSIISPATRSRS